MEGLLIEFFKGFLEIFTADFLENLLRNLGRIQEENIVFMYWATRMRILEETLN